MPHNSGPITEYRQIHNRNATIYALTEVQNALGQAEKALLRAGQLPKELGDIRREHQADVFEHAQLLKGMVTNLRENLDELFLGGE